jgi:hypothetical protein
MSDIARIEKMGWTLCKVPIEFWRQRTRNLAESIHLPLDQWSPETRELLHKVYSAISIPFLCENTFLVPQ